MEFKVLRLVVGRHYCLPTTDRIVCNWERNQFRAGQFRKFRYIWLNTTGIWVNWGKFNTYDGHVIRYLHTSLLQINDHGRILSRVEIAQRTLINPALCKRIINE